MDGFGDLWPWNPCRSEPEKKEMEFPGTAPGLLDQSLVYFANANGGEIKVALVADSLLRSSSEIKMSFREQRMGTR